MAKISIKAGATSVTVNVFIQDSTSTVGAGKTGLAFNTASLIAYYMLPAANSVAITLATQTVTGAWSSGGFVEIDSTHCPGWYRLDLPNAAIASGRYSSINLQGATGMAQCPVEIELTGWDNQDAVHGGMSALPNTAVTTNASLLTSGTGTDQLSVAAGLVNVGKINSVSTSSVTTVNANVGTTQPTNFTGTAGSALVKSDMVDIAGSAVSTTTAQIGVNSVQVNAVPTSSVTTINANLGTTQPLNFTGTAASALVKCDTVDIAGTASAGAAGYVGIDWGHINAPTTTVNLSGTTVGTATTVTNQLTAAAIATGVWQDATAGDFTAASSIGKSLYTAGVAPGAAGGLFIAGTNAATTVTTAFTTTFTGNLTGSVGSVTGSVGGNVVGSVGSVTGSVGSVTGNVGGNVAGSVGSVVASVTVGTNNDKTGYTLSSAGLDSIVIETSYNARQALSIISASVAGVLSGVGSGTDTFRGAGVATTRISASVDGAGNRTAVTLTLP